MIVVIIDIRGVVFPERVCSDVLISEMTGYFGQVLLHGALRDRKDDLIFFYIVLKAVILYILVDLERDRKGQCHKVKLLI